MKVLLHYQDNTNVKCHKSLKITLPKSWKAGPTSRLLQQFVESYNASSEIDNTLDESTLHFEIDNDDPTDSDDNATSEMKEIASDAIVINTIPDRANLYIRHGPSRTMAQLKPSTPKSKPTEANNNLVRCTNFGCQKKFPKGGPYPECCHHIAPPVFHETAKFWSCCPTKKAYDWDDFQNIPGCQKGRCTEVKKSDSEKGKQGSNKMFLGGCDLREIAAEKAGVKLKSIDDFNQSQLAGGSESAPVLVRLKGVLEELGIEGELFDQVIQGIKKDSGDSVADEWEGVAEDLGNKLKKSFKAIAVEQLRIK